MKRMLIAVAALGLAAGAARADWGGPGGAPAGGAMPAGPIGAPNTLFAPTAPMNGVAPDPYGVHPGIKRLFRLGSTPKSQYYPQMGYTQSGPAYNPTGYPPGAYGPAQGTLVFPHHTFARSPRDFFMLDVNK